jgi:hypothetical protein
VGNGHAVLAGRSRVRCNKVSAASVHICCARFRRVRA